MRAFLLILLLAIVGSAFAQEEKPHGKTEAQILKMGSEAWMNYYTDTVGGSTADMSRAASLYGTAAFNRNEKLLEKQLDGDFKLQILKLRKGLNAYAAGSVDVQYALTGGGTMYIPMWAMVKGDVEDVLYCLLSASGPKPKSMVVSKVTKRLDAIGKHIAEAAKNAYVKAPEAKRALGEMRKAYAQIVTVAKTMSRRDSDRLLEFCFDKAELIEF